MSGRGGLGFIAAMATENGENPGEVLHSIDLIEARTGNVVRGGDVLRGKVAAVVIAPHWLPMPLRQTLASLSEHLDQLKDEGRPVEFVYVAVDRDEEFIGSLKAGGNEGMLDEGPDEEVFGNLINQFGPGWLAVPLQDGESRTRLLALKEGFFGFAFLGENGETLTKNGMNLIYKWGAEGFPYSSDRIAELEKVAEERTSNQSLRSLLVNSGRDFVIKNDGSQVKVESLEGKVVGLYFSAHWCGPCRRFTPVLADLYKKLGDKFEVVFVSADRDEAAFEEYHREMPWLAVPYSDAKQRKLLDRWFEVEGIPMLVILDEQGKTVCTEAVELIFKHGIDAFPFTPAKLAELKAEEDKKRAAQTIESLLVTDKRDSLIASDGKELKVGNLKGKTVGLYFSAHWCPPCRGFTPSLIAVYNQLKQEKKEFEVVFVSSDRDEEAFKSYFGSMPWLALPFSDRHSKSQLSSYFEVEGIPTLVIIGPDGKTVTRDGRSLVGRYNAEAYPFTEEHLKRLEERMNEEAAAMPKEVKISSHPEHPLLLLDDPYNNGGLFGCDICDGEGKGRMYHCEACSFDVHPHCAKSEIEAEKKAGGGKEGWVCEGDVCKKA